jgi:hypothetical protein
VPSFHILQFSMPQFWEAISITNAVSFLPTSTVSGLLKFTVLSVMIDISQHKIMLADSSTGSGFYIQHGGEFLSSS